MEPILLQPADATPPDEQPVLLEPAEAPAAPAVDATLAPQPTAPEPRRGLFRTVGGWIGSGFGWLFGSLSLIVGLAVLAAIPIVQFLSLGYLLEAAGRIGRTGRLRHAFPGVRLASVLGRIAIGSALAMILWWYLDWLRESSELIDPTSPQTAFMRLFVKVMAVLTPLHILFAVSRGGRLRYFFWPFNFVWFVRRLLQGGYFRECKERVVATWRELRLWHYFSLGFRGYLGAAAWLVIPSTLYAIGHSSEPAMLLSLPAGILLAIAIQYLPFLQVRFAAENRLRAMFEVAAVRERFRHSPIAFLIAFVFTLLLVLPLYLFKVEVVPRDALWLPSLVFIVTIFPLKVMTGWAYGRAGRRTRRAWWITRFVCKLLMIPVALVYALVVFFTPYTGWHGVQALYEHHAFLLPVPF